MNTPSPTLLSQFQRNIVIQWLVPERVILIQARGEVNLQQREWAHAQITALIHSCSTPSVHLISDTKQMTHIPWYIFSRPSVVHAHPRRGWWINIGDVPTMPLPWLSRLMGKLLRRRYVYSASFEEALILLQKLDPTLPDLRAFVAKIETRRVAEAV